MDPASAESLESLTVDEARGIQSSSQPPNIFSSTLTHSISVDNSTKPFCPRLTSKPHALKPLDLAVIKAPDGTECYPHPYAFELEHFSLPPKQLIKGDIIEPKQLSQTSLDFIGTKQQLDKMITELKSATEIAVDVEEYRYHSYQGLTCLVQISTRQKDYIIDALKLRDDLHELNEIFTNPKVIKVLHGADGDIVWLQRDLSVYIVNMFDTHQACHKLEFPQKSLAYLMEYYCNVKANKTSSMKVVDWRIRPLSEELYTYAREDTHYLLYIFDRMRHDLLDKAKGESNLLKDVYDLSISICKRTYQKPKVTPDYVKKFCIRHNLEFNNRQLFVLNKLCMWRDKVARDKDECWGVVLPNNAMISIAEQLPVNQSALLACCSSNSDYVKEFAKLLCGFSTLAMKQPLEADDETSSKPADPSSRKSN